MDSPLSIVLGPQVYCCTCLLLFFVYQAHAPPYDRQVVSPILSIQASTNQFAEPSPLRAQAGETAPKNEAFGVSPREVPAQSLPPRLNVCKEWEGGEAIAIENLCRAMKMSLKFTENIFDECFKSTSIKLRQFQASLGVLSESHSQQAASDVFACFQPSWQTRLLVADALTQKASLSLARAAERTGRSNRCLTILFVSFGRNVHWRAREFVPWIVCPSPDQDVEGVGGVDYVILLNPSTQECMYMGIMLAGHICLLEGNAHSFQVAGRSRLLGLPESDDIEVSDEVDGIDSQTIVYKKTRVRSAG